MSTKSNIKEWVTGFFKNLPTAFLASGILSAIQKKDWIGFNLKIKEKIQKKIKFILSELNDEDKERVEILKSKLSVNENQQFSRWLKKLESWQRNQLWLLLIGIYNDFSLDEALAVLKAFINTPDDDSDEYKTAVLLEDGILTDYNPLNVFHEEHPIGKTIDEAKKAGDNFNKKFEEEIITPLEALNKSLAKKVKKLKKDLKNGR